MDYLTRAAALGQDVEALQRGDVVTSHIEVKSIVEYRAIFGAAQTSEHRAAYTALRPEQTALDPEMQMLLDYVFGTQELTPELAELAEHMFPMTILATSASDLTISTDMVVGPGGQSYALNVGNLTFDGGSLTVNSTVSTIAADDLIITPEPSHTSANPYHIGIIGNTGAQGTQGNPGPNYTSAANPGTNGTGAVWGTCTSNDDGGTGSTGAQGQPGYIGNNGANGSPSLNASITITTFDPSNINAFVIQTSSGAGGVGGTGGQGGTGQTGGTGGAGCNSGCEGSQGGRGGNGGTGGTGGTGGPGGSGVAGYPITINFPGSSKTMLTTLSYPAPAGAGGAGGPGGTGGAAGAGGAGGKHNDNGPAGGTGITGTQGTQGTTGTATGTAGNYSIVYT